MHSDDNGIGSYRRFLKGDSRALEELIALYQRALLLFIYGYTHDFALSEDISVDVFFELYRRKKPFEERAKFKTYLFKIARNKSLNAIKRRARRREQPLETAFELSDPSDTERELIKGERARRLHSALEKLPENYREVLHLRYFEELSPEEISAVTGGTKKQVYNLLDRGRVALKSILLAEGFVYEVL